METNDDYIFRKFFEADRWEYALEKGIGKEIKRADLYGLSTPQLRKRMVDAIASGEYVIAPPRTQRIPKDGIDPETGKQKFRVVYINAPIDRIFLSIANDLLCELTPEMIHPCCTSYQKGVGCGKVVKEAAARMGSGKPGVVMGFKSDLSKYFDSVPIEFIDTAFDRVEGKFGHSVIIDVLRKYYHSNWYWHVVDESEHFDKSEIFEGRVLTDRFETKQGILTDLPAYQSLKQGCAVASWLANVCLYHIDDKLSKTVPLYVRYSDDMICIGENYEIAMETLKDELAQMQMQLNPKKVEYLVPDKWFKFLGFSIKGRQISLSSSQIKKFQREIEDRCGSSANIEQAIRKVHRYLYKGDGRFSWATRVLPIINVHEDLMTLNNFVLDAIRAVGTGKMKIGGLGYVVNQKVGCISRGKGRNIKANREKIHKENTRLFCSLGMMQNAIRTSMAAYYTLVNNAA